MLKIVKNPTQKQIVEFEKLANENWGEHSHDGNPSLDFFDIHRIVYENYKENELVSGLAVFLKSILFFDRILHIAGIGGVVTHKDFRNKGYATETLRFAIKNLEGMNLAAAFLCTDINKLGTFYERIGFTPLNKPYYFIDKLGAKKTETGGMIANLGNTESYKFILNTKEEIFVGLSNF